MRTAASTSPTRSRRPSTGSPHSVAEHAIFNFDIIGVSRFAVEELEKFRLCSYTEKSQRYIKLDKDFVIPEEIKGTSHEKMFVEMIQKQNEAYFVLFEKLKEHVFNKHTDLAQDPKHAGIRDQLRNRLIDRMKETQDPMLACLPK